MNSKFVLMSVPNLSTNTIKGVFELLKPTRPVTYFTKHKSFVWYCQFEHRGEKINMIARPGSSFSVDYDLTVWEPLLAKAKSILLVLQMQVAYHKEVRFLFDNALNDHKILIEYLPDVPYIVWVTGHDTPNAMTDDQLRQRWKEETGHDDITILHFSGTENFREEFLKIIDGLHA